MVSVTSASPIHALVVRRMGFPFDGVPRYWFGNSAFRTHLVNGINFVFPAGERFFIRSVNHYSNLVSKEMRERIRGFAGQDHRLGWRSAGGKAGDLSERCPGFQLFIPDEV